MENADKMKRPVSVVLSILFVILILVIVVSAVVPQLTKTVVELVINSCFAENAGVWLEGLRQNIRSYRDMWQSWKRWQLIGTALLRILWNF